MLTKRCFANLAVLKSAPASLTLTIGDSASLKRTFTADEVKKFGECIGDLQSKDLLYRNDIVYGAFSSSLFTTLFRQHFPASIYLNQETKFKRPVLVNQEVTARIEVVSVNKKDVVLSTQISVNEEVAVEGTARLRIPYLE